MNKKTVLTALFISVLLLSSTTSIYAVKADSNEPVTFSSGLTVYSPLNTIYNSYSVLCNVTFSCPLGIQCSLNYSIDGKYQDALPVHFPAALAFVKNYILLGSFYLPPLSNGPHQISFGIEEDAYNYSVPPSDAFHRTTGVNGLDYYVASWVNTVSFTIYSTEVFPTPTPTPTIAPPEISSISIKNITYDTADIPLNFTTDKPVNWEGYSIDGKENVTINGNTTLTGLSNGMHNITIYVKDAFGNVDSQTIDFNIAKQEPFPIITVAVVSAAVLVVLVIFCLIVYFKKRKSNINLN